ncbi:MAG: glycosyltransferase family 1 protein [Marinosulfonomonas sp.]|nr:glycosyltransferase family 1 protein [Marinosulfonomonas sp.]
MRRDSSSGTYRIAYFAHDWGDAAIKRRVAGFQRDGLNVAGFAMHRANDAQPDWVVTDLGQTHDNKYLHRALSIPRGAKLAQGHVLEQADLIVARNLDMLLVALQSRRRAGLKTPVVYECLDIHRLVARDDAIGTVFRTLERQALRKCAGLWVSSPSFLSEYFEIQHPGDYNADLLENRLQDAPAPRPSKEHRDRTSSPLRIGWFGNLRCVRSLSLLRQIAADHQGAVEIVLRGYPADAEIPDFHEIVAAQPGLSFGGRYQYPDDLGAIYHSVDVVWAGDFMDAGKNSDWLLPNRLYEGGWFGCPPIAPASSQTGKWIAGHGCGFTLDEPLDQTLPALISSLLDDPAPISKLREGLLALPDDVFIEPAGLLANLVQDAVGTGLSHRPGGKTAPRVSIAPSA